MPPIHLKQGDLTPSESVYLNCYADAVTGNATKNWRALPARRATPAAGGLGRGSELPDATATAADEHRSGASTLPAPNCYLTATPAARRAAQPTVTRRTPPRTECWNGPSAPSSRGIVSGMPL